MCCSIQHFIKMVTGHWRSPYGTRREEQFEMHETMSGKAPVILGGHEHTIFEEETPG